MSYCRFSCEDYKSDVYVYFSEDGYVTHVASNRVVNLPTLPERVPFDEDPDAYFVRHAMLTDAVRHADKESIDHPAAGEYYIDGTPADCLERLLWLQGDGFYVPQYALDDLREEAAA